MGLNNLILPAALNNSLFRVTDNTFELFFKITLSKALLQISINYGEYKALYITTSSEFVLIVNKKVIARKNQLQHWLNFKM